MMIKELEISDDITSILKNIRITGPTEILEKSIKDLLNATVIIAI
ncbi:hypothetical protein [Clostridium perfringens]|nr:hypothetical protein [Clostridium perfringens]